MHICATCERPLGHKEGFHGRCFLLGGRLFCSKACYNLTIEKTCIYCGIKFVHKNAARFVCDECRIQRKQDELAKLAEEKNLTQLAKRIARKKNGIKNNPVLLESEERFMKLLESWDTRKPRKGGRKNGNSNRVHRGGNAQSGNRRNTKGRNT